MNNCDVEVNTETASSSADTTPKSEIENATFVLSRAKGAREKAWIRQEFNFLQFLDLFSNHRLDRKKDGPAFVAGELNGVERKAQAMNAAYFMVFDIDAEQSYDEVRDILNRENIHAIMYTTYSHLKTKSYIKTDKFVQWCKKNGIDPANETGVLHTQDRMEKYVDDADMREKLGSEFKVEERLAQTEDGMQICLTHKPIEKFRVLIPLGPIFVFSLHGYTSGEQAQAWKRAYVGVGRKLGLKFDMACADPSHIFYLPSHPPLDDNSEAPHRLDHLIDPVVEGGPERVMLDFNKYPKADLADTGKRGAASAGLFMENVTAGAADIPRELVRWKAKFPGFDMGALAIAKGFGTDVPGKGAGFECPFPHTETGSDSKTMVLRTEAGSWCIKCLGESCSGRDTLEYVQHWLEAGTITHADLENPEYGGGPFGRRREDEDAPADDDEEEKPRKSKSWLRTKLAGEDAWAVAAMLLLYELQTEDEKFGQGAGSKNGVGFNKGDAYRLTPLVEKWSASTPLTRAEFSIIKRRVPKYAGTQLLSLLSKLEARVDEIETALDEMTSDEPSDLPPAYFRDEDDDTGETRVYTSGEKGAVEVCQNFEVRAATLDMKAHHGIGIRFADRRGKRRDMFFKQGELAGKGTSWLETLSDEGFESYNDGKLRDLLRRLRTDKVALRVGKPGWHLHNGREEFVLPDSDIDDVVYVGRIEHVTRDPNGNLECWKDTAKLAEGNSRLVFALGAAFVGPLQKPFNAESGGYLLAGKSSEGKSAALCLNASVWGHGPVSLKATPTSIESVLEEMNDCGGSLDELGEMEYGAGDVAYMAGNGFGKSRGKPNGERQDVRSFRVSVLFSGEMSLADKIESENKRLTGGQETRVVTVPSNAGAGYGIFDKVPAVTGNATSDGAAFAERIKAETKQNYGHAGPAFVEWLKSNRAKTAEFENLAEIADALTPADAEPQARRVARRFALVIVAGELAIEAGVLPLPPNSVMAATHRLFHEWLEQRGGAAQTEALQGARRVWEHVKQHPRDFEPMGNNSQVNNDFAQPLKRMGYVDSDGRTFYWFTHSFRDVAKTPAVADVAKYMHQKGALDKDAGKGWTKSKKINGTKDRYYAVRLPETADASRTWIDDLLSQQQPENEDFELADAGL